MTRQKGLSRVRWEINSELDQLLAGLLQVSGARWRTALAQLGQ